MEKQILVPTNFSKHAWNALVFGLKLYKSISCNFILLNVFFEECKYDQYFGDH